MKRFFSMISLLLFTAISQIAAQSMEFMEPTINPQAQIQDESGNLADYTNYAGSAPLEVHFVPGDSLPEGYSGFYEWHFYENEIVEGGAYLVRHEKETDFTFSKAGTHLVCLVVKFTDGEHTTDITEQDYIERAYEPISITISTSKLEFPNAFSPNGDGVNDIYRAKQGYQSIVEFKATIYNRWGQKIFEWTNPDDGWDGTYHGSDVKDGVYFVHVQAKGADGIRYNIKKDVNLLRGYTETASGGNN